MDLFDLFLSLAFLAAVVGGQYIALRWYEYHQKNTWKLIAEGVYERIETRRAPASIKSFTNYIMMMMTISTVFFRDGTTCKAMDIAEDLPDSGTRIKIYKNGMAEFRVEKVS